MKCQRQILRIRWQDHVRNDEVAVRTGLRPVMESIRRRREAIFGHVARMSPNIPAHQALRLQDEASVGRRPDRDWVRSSGRPRNRWIDQLRQDHQRPPGDLWASSHPAWSHWSDATVLDDYAMTTMTTNDLQDNDDDITLPNFCLFLAVFVTFWLIFCKHAKFNINPTLLQNRQQES